MNTGMSGAHSTMMIPDTQSAGKTNTRIASGMKADSVICGR